MNALAHTDDFTLAPVDPADEQTPAAIVALVETIQARDGIPEASIAKAIGMTRQNFWQTKKGYKGKKLTNDQWRSLQALADGQIITPVAQEATENSVESIRCTATPDMIDGIEQEQEQEQEQPVAEPVVVEPVAEQPDAEPVADIADVGETIEADEPRYRIAFVSNKESVVTKVSEGTWKDLGDLLKSPKIGPKDGPGWLPALIEPGSRTKARVTGVQLLVLDLEAETTQDQATKIKTAIGPEPPSIDEFASEIDLHGWRAFIHTSHSHLDPEIRPTDADHPRYRVVLALSRTLEPDELEPFGRHIAARLGVADCTDRGSYEPNRLFYLPRCPAERLDHFEFVAIEGDPIDVDSALAQVRREAEAIRRTQEQRQQRTEGKRGEVIATFNNAHDVGAILEQHGYIRKRGARWLHPDSSTGEPGVRLLPDSDPPRIFSSHGCCPLNDGHAHDAFDCWRILNGYGDDFRAAVREAARMMGMDSPPRKEKADRTQQETHRDDYRQTQADPQPEAESEPEAPVSRLKRCDLSNLRNAELAAPEFVVDPLIPRRHVTLFGGHGGSGKSSVALAMGAHVACGYSWGGFASSQGRVLFLSYEDDEALVLWRLKRIATEYQLPMSVIAAHMTVIDATEAEALMIEYSDQGVRRLAATGDGEELFKLIGEGAFDLVIIDNASDAFDGDENNRRQVRQFVRRCAKSVRDHNGAILLLAHIDKNAARFGAGKNSYSGSTAWHNSARSRLALIDDELQQEKLNVGKEHPNSIPLEWRGPVPVPSAHSGADQARALVAEADDAAIVECFRSAEATGETVPAASTGPATYVHILTNYPECPAPLKADKTRIKESVARLLLKKIIRREEYKNADRKVKTRLVLADDCKHGVAPMCANVELEQIDADRHTLCAAPMRIGGVGDWSGAENEGIGTGALAHSESPASCADDIDGMVEGEV